MFEKQENGSSGKIINISSDTIWMGVPLFLYFFDPSGNRLELRDPTWQAGMPEPTFDELANA